MLFNIPWKYWLHTDSTIYDRYILKSDSILITNMSFCDHETYETGREIEIHVCCLISSCNLKFRFMSNTVFVNNKIALISILLYLIQLICCCCCFFQTNLWCQLIQGTFYVLNDLNDYKSNDLQHFNATQNLQYGHTVL